MTTNKTTVEKYMEGFRRGDHAMILSCLTDDVTWYMPGFINIAGKDAYDKEIENDAFTGLPTITIMRMIEENDIVVAEGTVQAAFKAGGLLDAVFCDVFHMRGGLISHLSTYQMNK